MCVCLYVPERVMGRERERESLCVQKKKHLQKVEEVYTADSAELQELERQQSFTMCVCEHCLSA